MRTILIWALMMSVACVLAACDNDAADTETDGDIPECNCASDSDCPPDTICVVIDGCGECIPSEADGDILTDGDDPCSDCSSFAGHYCVAASLLDDCSPDFAPEFMAALAQTAFDVDRPDVACVFDLTIPFETPDGSLEASARIEGCFFSSIELMTEGAIDPAPPIPARWDSLGDTFVIGWEGCAVTYTQAACETADGDIEPDGDISDGDDTDADEIDNDLDGDLDGDIADGDTDGDTDGDVDQRVPYEPQDPGYDGYLVATLHNNTWPDAPPDTFKLFTLSPEGEWTAPEFSTETEERPSFAVFTVEGDRLLIGHEGGELAVYHIRNGEAIFSHLVETGRYIDEMVALDSDRVLVLDGNPVAYDGGLYMLDVSAEPVAILEDFAPLHAPGGLAVSPDGRFVVTFGGEDLEGPTNTALIPLNSWSFGETRFFDLWDDYAVVHRPSFSSDGTRLAAGNESYYSTDGGAVKLFAFDETNGLTVLDSTEVETPSSFVFSDDDETLYVGSWQANTLQALSVSGDVFSPLTTLQGMPLLGDIIPLRTGPLSGNLVAAPYNALVLLSVGEDGRPSETARISSGGESENNIGGIAVGQSP
ncbi:MAG: hypothetical protein C4523_02840 [Myxococcales bacterium]|nr:MAG: hypothetical protein C4523_02840 [Myxococcales bacterium]